MAVCMDYSTISVNYNDVEREMNMEVILSLTTRLEFLKDAFYGLILQRILEISFMINQEMLIIVLFIM